MTENDSKAVELSLSPQVVRAFEIGVAVGADDEGFITATLTPEAGRDLHEALVDAGLCDPELTTLAKSLNIVPMIKANVVRRRDELLAKARTMVGTAIFRSLGLGFAQKQSTENEKGEK
jgi:hypothetical protein